MAQNDALRPNAGMEGKVAAYGNRGLCGLGRGEVGRWGKEDRRWTLVSVEKAEYMVAPVDNCSPELRNSKQILDKVRRR